jgi:hypothetical protein
MREWVAEVLFIFDQESRVRKRATYTCQRDTYGEAYECFLYLHEERWGEDGRDIELFDVREREK